LRNTVERSVILADGPLLSWAGEDKYGGDEDLAGTVFPSSEMVSLEDLEQAYIQHVLRHSGGKKTRAARILGIDKTTLWRKLKRYDLN
jgi:DNA-binding NtrC family response regulator